MPSALLTAGWLALLAAGGVPYANSDCTAPSFQRVLQPATTTTADARAYWLSTTLLRWPDKTSTARYRLYHSRSGQLDARPSQTVRGADASWPLQVSLEPLAPALATRFAYAGEGATLRLPKLSSAQLAAALQGQLLLVQEDAAARVQDATALQLPGVLDEVYAAADAADDLGVRVEATRTRFALWAPTAQRVELCAHTGANLERHALQRDAVTGVWRGALGGDRSGGTYTYLVDVFVPGVGLVRNRVTDPYALSLDADSRRSWIGRLDAPDTQPPGWAQAPRPDAPSHAVDQTIYELHVRDFSISDASVPAALRGKYLAFTTESDGMRHLRALAAAGLTDVHLLPVFDIASVPEVGCVTPLPAGPPDSASQQAAVLAVRERDCFNWGYDPLHFGAPEGSYASDAADGAVRIREFRAMVQALHAAGLRVGMDAVYNHTSASGQQQKSVLDRIVPGYYHRLDARGQVERSTCCDNTATEHRMMAKLMRDTVVRWVRDYRIDAFRFDLMGHQPRDAMLATQAAARAAAGREVPMLGEGWNFGEVANGARFVQAAQGRLDGSGIATFGDRLRDAARGGGCCDTGLAFVQRQGWLNGLYYAPNAEAQGTASRADLLRAADLVRAGLAGSLRDYELTTHTGETLPLHRIDYAGQPAGYVSAPNEVVNYVENHDNPTLFDINVLKLPIGTTREDRARVQLLGAALVAFSQGIAYYHAGIDTLRSKSLDRNSFDSGDWFNPLDWSYRDNGFGRGLPPAPDNAASWPWQRPRLADPALKPTPAEIAWMRDAFRDLLRLRAGSTLFRLRTAEDIRARLRLPLTSSPTLIAGRIDGQGYPGAPFAALLYLLNAEPRPQTLTLAEERDRAWVLHPIHRAANAADRRAREARFDAASGGFTVPPRTAVVFVIE